MKHTLAQDLSATAQGEVRVSLVLPNEFQAEEVDAFSAVSLDDLDIEVNNYEFNPEYLHQAADASNVVTESLMTDLLKSNCLITNQPDWATLIIRYTGPKIDREQLLRYCISFRTHNEFHEQCVERIFTDLMTHCQCEKLTVYARYTRRGGLDINPFRSNFESTPENKRLARQ